MQQGILELAKCQRRLGFQSFYFSTPNTPEHSSLVLYISVSDQTSFENEHVQASTSSILHSFNKKQTHLCQHAQSTHPGVGSHSRYGLSTIAARNWPCHVLHLSRLYWLKVNNDDVADVVLQFQVIGQPNQQHRPRPGNVLHLLQGSRLSGSQHWRV